MGTGCWVAALAICGIAAAQPRSFSSGDSWTLHIEAGRTLETNGRFAEAKDEFEAALRTGVARDARSFAARIELGIVAAAMGEYVEAEQWDNEAVRLGMELYGKDSPDLALPYINLAALYRDQGKAGEAEGFGRRALQLITSRVSAPPDTRAHVLGTLGGILSQEGKLAEAETQLQESIEIAKTLPQPSDILAGDWNNLADLYAKTGRPTQALDAYLGAYKLCDQAGGNDPCHFYILAGIASVRASSGNYAEAVSAIESGIHAAEAAGAGNTMQTRDALAAEAVWLHKLKRDGEAKRVRARLKQVAEAATRNSYSRYTLDAREVAQSMRKPSE
jgi:tetratricopeptide (TPR) repeat protein